MKDERNIKNIYDCIYLDKTFNELHDNFIFKKIKQKKLKFATIFFTFLIGTTISIAMINSNSIKNIILNNGNKAVTFTNYDKVNIPKNAILNCDDNLTINKIEKALNINLLDYSPYNKNTFDQCIIKKDSNNNITSVDIYNDDNFIEYENATVQERIENNLITKKYLALNIKFNTNYATVEDEDNFKNSLVFEGSPESIDTMTEDYYIKNLNTTAKIIKIFANDYIINDSWPNTYNDPWPNTYSIFIYNGVFYQFTGYYFNKEEMINVLENLKL